VREDPIRALPPGLLCRAVLSEPLAVGIRALQRAAWRASGSRSGSGSGSGSGSVELSALIAKKVDYRRAFRFDTEFDDALVVLATHDVEPVVTDIFALAQAWEAVNSCHVDLRDPRSPNITAGQSQSGRRESNPRSQFGRPPSPAARAPPATAITAPASPGAHDRSP
jgi:hypothetical protein